MPCRGQEPLRRRGGAHAQDARVHPGGVGAQHQQPVGGAQFPGPLQGSHDDGGGRVRVEAGVPGGDSSAGHERGREPRHQRRRVRLGRGPSSDSTVSGRRPQRNNFAGERCPTAAAARARRWLSRAKRVLPLAADAEIPGDVLRRDSHVRVAETRRHELGPANRTPGSPSAALLARRGAVLMLSTPPARYDRFPPAATSRAASTMASRPEPHCRSTVMPGTLTGKPASRSGQPGHVAAAAHGVADHDVRQRPGAAAGFVRTRPRSTGARSSVRADGPCNAPLARHRGSAAGRR